MFEVSKFIKRKVLVWFIILKGLGYGDCFWVGDKEEYCGG